MIVPHTEAKLRVSSPQLAHPHSVVCVIKSQMSFQFSLDIRLKDAKLLRDTLILQFSSSASQ